MPRLQKNALGLGLRGAGLWGNEVQGPFMMSVRATIRVEKGFRGLEFRV